MLSKISAVTAAVAAIVNVAVLLGWSLDAEQVAAINGAVVAVGAVVHSWFNPNIPIGTSE
jgi:hypothetical protein